MRSPAGQNRMFVVFERADESLPTGYAPDARFVLMSPGGKPRGVRRDVDRPHCVFAIHVDDLFLRLSVPHAGSLPGPTHYSLVILRHRHGVRRYPHSRLVCDLFTVCKSPPSDSIITPAQNVHFVGVEHDCVYPSRATVVKYYRLVLLKSQHYSMTPRSCYTPVFVDDILTNGTQSLMVEMARRKVFRFTRARKRCSTNTPPYNGLCTQVPRDFGAYSYSGEVSTR